MLKRILYHGPSSASISPSKAGPCNLSRSICFSVSGFCLQWNTFVVVKKQYGAHLQKRQQTPTRQLRTNWSYRLPRQNIPPDTQAIHPFLPKGNEVPSSSQIDAMPHRSYILPWWLSWIALLDLLWGTELMCRNWVPCEHHGHGSPCSTGVLSRHPSGTKSHTRLIVYFRHWWQLCRRRG